MAKAFGGKNVPSVASKGMHQNKMHSIISNPNGAPVPKKKIGSRPPIPSKSSNGPEIIKQPSQFEE